MYQVLNRQAEDYLEVKREPRSSKAQIAFAWNGLFGLLARHRHAAFADLVPIATKHNVCLSTVPESERQSLLDLLTQLSTAKSHREPHAARQEIIGEISARILAVKTRLLAQEGVTA